MPQLSSNAQKWLKSLHLLTVSLWVGGAIALNLMLIFIEPCSSAELSGINRAMKFVDDFVIIPGAIGCLLTGIVYSLFTKWGWFRHRWVTVKWIITVYGILFGTFFLGPWLNQLVPIAENLGAGALKDAQYIHNTEMLLIMGNFQLFTLVFALFISVLKPWKQKK